MWLLVESVVRGSGSVGLGDRVRMPGCMKA